MKRIFFTLALGIGLLGVIVYGKCDESANTHPTPSPIIYPTVSPALPREDRIRALRPRFVHALGKVPHLEAFGECPNGMDDYSERLKDAIAQLLSDPAAQDLDIETLQDIINKGVGHANYISRTRFYENGPEYLLTYVGQISCREGSHYSSPTGELVVFSRSGEYWSMGSLMGFQVFLVDSEWIMLADLSSTMMGSVFVLWQITRVDGHWQKTVIDTFQNEISVGITMDGNRVLLSIQGAGELPCQLPDEILDHSIANYGYYTRVYMKTGGAYTFVEEILDEYIIRVVGPGGRVEDVYTLENWEEYCIDDPN
jgi:hypothetical protein